MGSDSKSESADRTLPEALDARRVSLGDARRTLAPPDTVNIAAYVVEYRICPEKANCLLPDGVVIAESRDPDDDGQTRRIAVEKPRQFVKGSRYLISLSVTSPSDRNLDENLLEIIGYSRIESGKRNTSFAVDDGLMPFSNVEASGLLSVRFGCSMLRRSLP